MLNLTWQVHVHGEAGSELRSWAEARGVPLYVWPWGAEAKAAGLRRDGAGGPPRVHRLSGRRRRYGRPKGLRHPVGAVVWKLIP